MSRGEHWVTAVFRRSEPNPKKTSVFEHFVLPNNKCCNRGKSEFRDAALPYTSTMVASRIIRMRCGMSMQKNQTTKYATACRHNGVCHVFGIRLHCEATTCIRCLTSAMYNILICGLIAKAPHGPIYVYVLYVCVLSFMARMAL